MKSLDDILKLLEALREMPFESMEVSAEGVAIRLERGGATQPAVAPRPVASEPKAAAPAEPPTQGAAGKAVTVTSPIIGVFYTAPSPEDAPYISVGEPVKAGQTLCIVEAMKLMNEIPSPISGTVVKVLANDSTEVEVGQALFLVEPSEG